MELYVFFTKPTTDAEQALDLVAIKENIQDECLHIEVVCREIHDGKFEYHIIGSIWGDDTSEGDITLLSAFGGIKYYWVDAYCPTINNLT